VLDKPEIALAAHWPCPPSNTKLTSTSTKALRIAKASLMLNLESTSSRMSSLAHSEMTFGRNMTPEEVIDAVEAVTVEDLQRMANDIFGRIHSP
jgi:predicted Zn-dependent peptidase